MAGEIEEPFSLSFQADSIHNGSISFGRFETECLSWERRSSFSHNRYLEEVEKYSKPGSVTEKKAYFEAHFKRKALLSRSSSDSQNGIQCQTSENDTSENMDYKDEFEHTNEGGHSVQFDESFDGSEYDGDCDSMECVRGDLRTSCVEPQFQTDFNNVNEAEQGVPEHVNPDKAYQTGAGSLPANDAEQGKEVIENLNDKSTNVGLTCKPVHLSTNCHSTGKDDSVNLEHRQEPCPKVGTKLESKLAKPRLKSSTQVQRNVSSEPSNCSAKKHIISKTEDSQSTKTEKHSSHTAILTTRWVCRTSKPEDPKSSKSKVIHHNRSEKELKTKKVVHEPKPSASEKLVPKACQNANRPKQVENSTKSGMKQSLAVFNFKSDERAERRKEFYMKLGEKKHAKKAGTNQIQANKLEKTEADIKQFRKSLDLKETSKEQSKATIANRERMYTKHRCGSRSIPVRVEKLAREKKMLPDLAELYKETHYNEKTHEWISSQAQCNYENMIQTQANHLSQPGSTPLTAEELSIIVLKPRSSYVKGLGMRPSSSIRRATTIYAETNDYVKRLEMQIETQKEQIQMQNNKIEDLEEGKKK